MTVNLDVIPVRTTIGAPKKALTGSSIKECVLMKLRLWSLRDFVSFKQVPGRGEGTLKRE